MALEKKREGRKDMVDDITGGAAGGRSGERATSTPNTIYDLSSVLFHALEGGASYDTYIEDAEREGDQELTDFFRRVRDEDSMRADEAQRLLAERTPTTTTASTAIEPVEGATAPNIGLAAGAPMREETAGRAGGRPDMDTTATDPGIGGAGQRVEPDAPPRTEEVPPPRTSGIEEGTLSRRGEAPPRTGSVSPGEGAVTEDAPGNVLTRTEEDAPLGREGAGRQPEEEREEDKGLIDRARDAILGEEEEPSRREESREARRGDDPLTGRP
jgi:hypothetical protein